MLVSYCLVHRSSSDNNCGSYYSHCCNVSRQIFSRRNDVASEALFVTGDFSTLTSLIEKPLIHARCFEDKLNIYNNLARSLAASGKLEEGLAMCVSVLSQLGEIIPINITEGIYHDEVNNVKRLLHGKSREELLSIPIMTDLQKLVSGCHAAHITCEFSNVVDFYCFTFLSLFASGMHAIS